MSVLRPSGSVRKLRHSRSTQSAQRHPIPTTYTDTRGQWTPAKRPSQPQTPCLLQYQYKPYKPALTLPDAYSLL